MRQLENGLGRFDLNTLKGLSEVAIDYQKILGISKAPEDINQLLTSIAKSDPDFFLFLTKAGHDTRREEILQIHTILTWLDSGLPVFDLTHSLAAALILTDPSDVFTEEVQAPFPTFAIRMPGDFWHLKDNQGQTRPIIYSLVHTWMAQRDPDRQDVEKRLVTRMIGRGENNIDITQIWEILPPPTPGKTVGEWLKLEVPEVEDAPQEGITRTGVDKIALMALRRLYVNLCLYVNEHGRGERQSFGKSKRKGKSELAKPLSPDIWILGRQIKLDSNLIKSAKAWTTAQAGDRNDWKVSKRFTVRGHWRQQSHGPERSLRKRIWIQPFWKGEGARLGHLYTVGENTP